MPDVGRESATGFATQGQIPPIRPQLMAAFGFYGGCRGPARSTPSSRTRAGERSFTPSRVTTKRTSCTLLEDLVFFEGTPFLSFLKESQQESYYEVQVLDLAVVPFWSLLPDRPLSALDPAAAGLALCVRRLRGRDQRRAPGGPGHKAMQANLVAF